MFIFKSKFIKKNFFNKCDMRNFESINIKNKIFTNPIFQNHCTIKINKSLKIFGKFLFYTQISKIFF